MAEGLLNVDPALFDHPTGARLAGARSSTYAPRFLLLYGSLRERSYINLLSLEAARLLTAVGGEVRIFDPAGSPLPDGAPEMHPKVQELRDAAAWAEGMVWTSPERHGAMTGVMQAQIDWIPLSIGAVRPMQGKTLAVMEVSGGSQSFNAVNQMKFTLLTRDVTPYLVERYSGRRESAAVWRATCRPGGGTWNDAGWMQEKW